jgi:pimeloyl-ACP methyl ester carboxylesterase
VKVDKLPIIYVRGFAGERGIEQAIQDPFYGFNEGSVHVRVGSSGIPSFYQFESPLLRLIFDEQYEVPVRGSQERYLIDARPGTVSPASLWVHRFYDVSASSLTDQAFRPGRDDEGVNLPESRREFSLEGAAESLLRLIRLVKDRTGAPRVHLVAHSMGGLICRCLIQKIIPEGGGHALEHIDRLFTYGTPHGGIHFDIGFGMLERLRDAFGIEGADVFGPDRMYAYLTPADQYRSDGPPKGWKANEIPEDAFPSERVFCLIGTNPADYDVAMGMSSKIVGLKSDGLVQIESAYVPNANFAFVHRSHSGRYGMVNSEEGYQNLHRFLFGDLEVTANLIGIRLPGEPDDDMVWQAETRLSIRGLPITMHEQLAAHYCPVLLERPRGEDTADRPIPLVTTFLSSRAPRPGATGLMRYVLQLRIISLREHNGIFWFGDHLEHSADFDDMLIVDVEPATDGRPPRAWAEWASCIPTALRDYRVDPGRDRPLTDEDPDVGEWQATLPLPSPSADFLSPKAAVRLTVRGRRPADDPSYRTQHPR